MGKQDSTGEQGTQSMHFEIKTDLQSRHNALLVFWLCLYVFKF